MLYTSRPNLAPELRLDSFIEELLKNLHNQQKHEGWLTAQVEKSCQSIHRQIHLTANLHFEAGWEYRFLLLAMEFNTHLHHRTFFFMQFISEASYLWCKLALKSTSVQLFPYHLRSLYILLILSHSAFSWVRESPI